MMRMADTLLINPRLRQTKNVTQYQKQWAIIESSESIILFFFVRWMPVIFKLTKPIEIAFNV